MGTCHIIEDLDFAVERREVRPGRMTAVLDRLGWKCRRYGLQSCDPRRAADVETQTDLHGLRTDFASRLGSLITAQADPANDVVVVTESWQRDCFRCLQPDGGKALGMPVVELWIDYLGSFARWRAFSTKTALDMTCGAALRMGWREDWVVARPYIPPRRDGSSPVGCPVIDVDPNTSPLSLRHLEMMRFGGAAAAPDWGVWRETIEPGISGYLWQRETQRAMMVRQAETLPKAEVERWTTSRFSLDRAAGDLEGFMGRFRR
jgi:hypothetical protein